MGSRKTRAVGSSVGKRKPLGYNRGMETVTRNVGDLDPQARTALERVVGHELRANQQLVIQVVSAPATTPVAAPSGQSGLPAWCNVYQGLTDTQIDDLDRAIVRSPTSRDLA